MDTPNNSANGTRRVSPTNKIGQTPPAETYDSRGKTVLIDLWGIKRESLTSREVLELLARGAAKAGNATIEEPLHITTPGGTSSVDVENGSSFTVHLLQSHATGHAWPEKTVTIKVGENTFKYLEGHITLDFLTCGTSSSSIACGIYSIEMLNPEQGSVLIVPRGEYMDQKQLMAEIKIYSLDEFKEAFKSEFERIAKENAALAKATQ